MTNKTIETTSKITRFRVRDAFLELMFTPVEGKVTQLRGKVSYSIERVRTIEND